MEHGTIRMELYAWNYTQCRETEFGQQKRGQHVHQSLKLILLILLPHTLVMSSFPIFPLMPACSLLKAMTSYPRRMSSWGEECWGEPSDLRDMHPQQRRPRYLQMAPIPHMCLFGIVFGFHRPLFAQHPFMTRDVTT